MALATKKPEHLKPQNDLDNIPDDVLGPVPAVLQAFGKDMLIMDKPPQPGELLKIEITLRCKDEGRELLDDGEFKHYRKCKSLGVRVTTEPYKPEADEDPSLLDENGKIPDDEPEGEPKPDDDGLGEFDPEFSHNSTKR